MHNKFRSFTIQQVYSCEPNKSVAMRLEFSSYGIILTSNMQSIRSRYYSSGTYSRRAYRRRRSVGDSE